MKRLIAMLLTLTMLVGTCVLSVNAASSDFNDIKDHWANDDIAWGIDEGIFKGVDASSFAPNLTLNRAMLVTLLYRMNSAMGKSGLDGSDIKLSDVPDETWYTAAVRWAVANEIVKGVDTNDDGIVFAPMDEIKRQDVATIFYRYFQSILQFSLDEYVSNTSLSHFTDATDVENYAIDAMKAFANEKLEIIKGYQDSSVRPNGSMTRAEAAAIFHRVYNFYSLQGGLIAKAYIEPNTAKILQEEKLTPNGQTTLTASLAKNESEGMQFILNFSQDVKDVSYTLSTLSNSNGETLENVDLYRQRYVKIYGPENAQYGYQDAPGGMYPDALVPMFDGSDGGYDNTKCDVTANKNQGYWITVSTAKDQTPGNYDGSVTVTYNMTETIKIPVRVTVWDFEIPTGSSSQTAFAMWYPVQYYVSHMQLGDSEFGHEIEKMYYEFFLKYRISSNSIPTYGVKITDPSAYVDQIEPYIKREEVSSYKLPLESSSTAGYVNTTANVNLLKELNNRGLLDKAYMYDVDEPQPTSQSDIRLVSVNKSNVANLQKAVFGAKDNPIDYPIPNFVTAADSTFDALITDWCPLWDQMTDARIKEKQALGSEVWWYSCGIPRAPYPTYVIQGNLMSSRLVHWMQRDTGVTGELYWATTLWGVWRDDFVDYNARDVWDDPYTLMDQVVGNTVIKQKYAGDGYLVYPGTILDDVVKRNVPVPTIRLEAIRDGFEDYEYLTMLENKYQNLIDRLGITDVSADDIMNTYYQAIYYNTTGTTTASTYDRDNAQLLLNVRAEIAEDIMRDDEDAIVQILSEGIGKNTVKTLHIYAKKGSSVVIDGQALTGTERGECEEFTYQLKNKKSEDLTKCEVLINRVAYHRILNYEY